MSRPRALENIRVVDFSWVRAGPWATRWLGAFGAEVIKIEWPENERGRLPSTTTPQNLEVNLNTSGNFNDTNVNKKSLSLNVRSAKGLAIVKRLIAVSDIVIDTLLRNGLYLGAVRAPEQLLDDVHLHNRGFWKEVEHPELGRSFVYPGEAAIYNGSPWRLSRRAPLIGEHNVDIFCGELGLSPQELSMLVESRVI